MPARARAGAARPGLAAGAGHALAAARRQREGPAGLEDPVLHLQLEEPQGARPTLTPRSARPRLASGLPQACLGHAIILVIAWRLFVAWRLISTAGAAGAVLTSAGAARGTPSRWTSGWRRTAAACRRPPSTTTLQSLRRRCTWPSRAPGGRVPPAPAPQAALPRLPAALCIPQQEAATQYRADSEKRGCAHDAPPLPRASWRRRTSGEPARRGEGHRKASNTRHEVHQPGACSARRGAP